MEKSSFPSDTRLDLNLRRISEISAKFNLKQTKMNHPWSRQWTLCNSSKRHLRKISYHCRYNDKRSTIITVSFLLTPPTPLDTSFLIIALSMWCKRMTQQSSTITTFPRHAQISAFTDFSPLTVRQFSLTFFRMASPYISLTQIRTSWSSISII